MSVIEFFTTYWDWYLLVALIIYISLIWTFWVNDKLNTVDFFIVLIGAILWPITLVSATLNKL